MSVASIEQQVGVVMVQFPPLSRLHTADQERSTLQKTSTDEAALGHATLKSTQNSLKPTHLDSQTAQIEEKEILIQEKRDILDQIVAVKGKEMAKLITDLEAAEDE